MTLCSDFRPWSVDPLLALLPCWDGEPGVSPWCCSRIGASTSIEHKSFDWLQTTIGANPVVVIDPGLRVAPDTRSDPSVHSTIGAFPSHRHGGSDVTSAGRTVPLFARHLGRVTGGCFVTCALSTPGPGVRGGLPAGSGYPLRVRCGLGDGISCPLTDLRQRCGSKVLNRYKVVTLDEPSIRNVLIRSVGSGLDHASGGLSKAVEG